MLNEQLKFQTTEWTRFSTLSFFFAFKSSKNIGHRPPATPLNLEPSPFLSQTFSFSTVSSFTSSLVVPSHDVHEESDFTTASPNEHSESSWFFFDFDSLRSTSGWCVWSVDVGRHSWSISRLRGCFRRPLIQSAAAADHDVLHYAVAFGDKSSN